MRAHQHSAGAIGGQEFELLGRSRGGFSTKIHARVDSLGRPHQILLSPGQSHECQKAIDLIKGSEAGFIAGDRGYDTEEVRSYLKYCGIKAVIPPCSNRTKKYRYNKEIYKERNIVERFFARIKQYRRIATRYDKTSKMFMSALSLVGILLWLK